MMRLKSDAEIFQRNSNTYTHTVTYMLFSHSPYYEKTDGTVML
jgi:hypothetical protein